MEATQILSAESVDKALDIVYANMLGYDGIANFRNPEVSAVVLFRRQKETDRTIVCELLYHPFPNDTADKNDEAKKLIKLFLGVFTKREKAKDFLEALFIVGVLQAIYVSICGVPMIITPWDSEEELFCRWSNLYEKMYS